MLVVLILAGGRFRDCALRKVPRTIELVSSKAMLSTRSAPARGRIDQNPIAIRCGLMFHGRNPNHNPKCHAVGTEPGHDCVSRIWTVVTQTRPTLRPCDLISWIDPHNDGRIEPPARLAFLPMQPRSRASKGVDHQLRLRSAPDPQPRGARIY
jgi:hypothetical protein